MKLTIQIRFLLALSIMACSSEELPPSTASRSSSLTEAQLQNDGVNFALGRPATGSVVVGANAGPELAVDGNVDGDFDHGSVSHSAHVLHPWWQVDLGVTRSINDVVLWNRTVCCAERLRNFYVFVSDSPFTSDDPTELAHQSNVRALFTRGGTAPGGATERRTSISIEGPGRFVRVQLTENGPAYLQLAEVQVWGRRNLAAGASVSASTQLDSPFGPDRASDGNVDGGVYGGSLFHSGSETNPWWEVDLGRAQSIGEVVLWNRTDCCSERLNKVHVFVSSTPIGSPDVTQTTTVINPSGVSHFFLPGLDRPEGDTRRRSVVPVNIEGRYVRIQLSYFAYLQLAEVEVHGSLRSTVAWAPAPVRLTAKNNMAGTSAPSERSIAEPITYTIPRFLPVRAGNAGNGQAELKLQVLSGPLVTCSYQGGAREAHPTTDLERMRGRRYVLTQCDNGYQAGQKPVITWISLRIISGDDTDPSGGASVTIEGGDGCSDQIPAHFAAEEVVAFRDNFAWDTVAKLPEIDVDGHVAVFHGLIYIESKEQLAALDRLRVLWSAMPLSNRYMTDLRGKCGRVEHSSDGRGAVVYAVFPARLFNMLRDFSIQALRANVAPPFKFIIPTPPDQAEYVNSDGSISYAALGSSGFSAWLSKHPGQQAGWFDDAVSWVSDAGSDAYHWTKDHLVDPAVHYGEYGWDYATASFDASIDFLSNGLDNIWEEIQSGLQEFVLVFSDKVTVKLHIDIMNTDVQFPAGSIMTRVWGPADAAGNRPALVPAGANVRVRQWGWGFLPVMDQAQLSETGDVTLEAVKGAAGRFGDDLCIELDTDYGMITTDFIPNEVCDFAEGRYGRFETNVNDTLQLSQPELVALTQIKDSSDYYRQVIGSDPYRFEVLTGWVANKMTSVISGQHRAMTLCLDFPGTGSAAVVSVLVSLGPLLGPVGAILGTIGIVGGTLISKDLWWPDAGDAQAVLESRGVMTHEYGHFAMCSLLFAEDGPPGLTGLLYRLGEEQDDSREDHIAQMTETWADNFAMQVVGGVNYIQYPDSTQTFPISFCIASPCIDRNFVGDNDYSVSEPYKDELARFQTLVYDAFDSSDPGRRFTLVPPNGDVWAQDPAGRLVISPTPYLANADERVTLNGVAWRRWVRHWLDRGQKPTPANVIGGLVDTMAEQGFNWCDRCDLVALHDKATPVAVRTSMAAPTMAERFTRWQACVASPEMTGWLGAPPNQFLNMDASCAPCPLHSFTGPSATCQACPANSIVVGNDCFACGGNVASRTAEDCLIP